MLLEPYCFIKYIEEQGVELLKLIDNWSEGNVFYYFFDEDLIIDISECIHISVAEQYLKKINLIHLINELPQLDCPCPN